MQIEERQLPVSELQVGMYVSRLEVPWERTGFLLQGLMIESQRDIDAIARYSRLAWIDIEKSRTLGSAPRLQTLTPGSGGYRPEESEADRLLRHEARVPFDEELAQARRADAWLSNNIVELLDSLRANRPISRVQVEDAVAPVVDSISRNPDAFLWLRSIRARDDYAYSHAINCCALAAAFGRYLGYAEDGLRELGTGGLLLDIGMSGIPKEAYDHPGPLEPTARAQVRSHVQAGLARADAEHLATGEARQMIQCHHERHDGSGYPRGISGTDIPVAGRIAAIVDSYDAMTSERPYRAAMSRATALQELYQHRGKRYQPEMVELFLRCLGVYPVGTLVELTHGEIAIVMAQNPSRRLRPRLMVLTDTAKRLLADFMPFDLLHGGDSAGDGVHIVRSVPPGSYGLDPQQLFL